MREEWSGKEGSIYDNDAIVWYENSVGIDFGDAPTPYPVEFGDDGARHGDVGPTLGATRDANISGANSYFFLVNDILLRLLRNNPVGFRKMQRTNKHSIRCRYH